MLGEALALGGFGVALAAVEVYIALRELTEAKSHVDVAYRQAWADGPPYTFFQQLKRIRAGLQALGLSEPQLPPFDPSQVKLIPDEAVIRTYLDQKAHR